jgi:hypothetical protein
VTLEDEEIVRMYWDRDENAISVTDVKYGKLCRIGHRSAVEGSFL